MRRLRNALALLYVLGPHVWPCLRLHSRLGRAVSSPAETFVSLHSQRATNSAVYEEYLHVVVAACYEQRLNLEGEKRGWVGLPYPSAEYNLEEIDVEARVLEKASDLHMTPDLIDELTKVRQGYIDDLEQQFGIVYQPGS